MAKIAKISLTADVKDFKKGIKEAQKTLMDMSDIKIAPKISAEFEQKLKKDLVEAQGRLTSKIEETAKALEEMGKKGVNVYDDLDAQDLIKSHAEYNDKLKETKKLLDDIARSEAPPSPDGGGTAATVGGGRKGSMLGFGSSKMAGMAGAVGLGLGVGSLFQGAQVQARERSRISAMTGVSYEDRESKLGFSRAERREPRGRRLAGALGRNISNDQLNDQIDIGEQMERAYGVGADTQIGMVETARKGGGGNEKKFILDALGGALKAELSGGAIGEYLSSMTDYMKEMSKGVNIDSKSIMGFGSVLAELPFFKQDPTRIFDAMGGINDMFKNGDRFQEAMVLKSIGQAAGGVINPAAAYMRKEAGINGMFGGKQEDVYDEKGKVVDTKTVGYSEEDLVGMGYSESGAKTMAASGKDILGHLMKNIDEKGKGKDGEDRTRESRLMEWSKALKLKSAGAGIESFEAYQNDKLTPEIMEKALANYGKSTDEIMQDRIEKTYDTFAKNVLGAAVRIEEAIEQMQKKIGEPMSKLVTTIDKEIISLDHLGLAVMALTTVTTAKTAVDLIGLGAEGAGLAAALGIALPVAVGAAAFGSGTGIDGDEQKKLDQYKKRNPDEDKGFKTGSPINYEASQVGMHWSDKTDYESMFGGDKLKPGKNGSPQASGPQLRGGRDDGITATNNLTTMQERLLIGIEDLTSAIIKPMVGGEKRMSNRVQHIPGPLKVGR